MYKDKKHRSLNKKTIFVSLLRCHEQHKRNHGDHRPVGGWVSQRCFILARFSSKSFTIYTPFFSVIIILCYALHTKCFFHIYSWTRQRLLVKKYLGWYLIIKLFIWVPLSKIIGLRGEKLNYNNCTSLLLRKSQNLFFWLLKSSGHWKFTVFVRFTFSLNVSNHAHIWYVTWPQ